MKAPTLRMREWRKKNPERQKENDRLFRLRHPDKIKENNKRRWAEHREEESARNKAYYPRYYQANREKIKAKRRGARHQVTQEWVELKTAEQDGCCAICRTP